MNILYRINQVIHLYRMEGIRRQNARGFSMKKDYENISLALRKEMPKLNAEFNVATLEVFGSYIRNEQNSNSDLDVLVTFSKAPDLLQFIELEHHLSDLLGLKVDLVMRSALKPNIGKRITAEAKPVL